MQMPKKITNEYLTSLPMLSLPHTGDMACYVRYDKVNNVVYLLDSDGNFTGKVAPADSLTKQIEEAERKAQEPSPDRDNGTTPEPPNAEDTNEIEQEPEESPKGQKKKWLYPALIAVAAIVVIIIAATLGKASQIVKEKTSETNSQTPTSQNIEATEENELPTTEQTEQVSSDKDNTETNPTEEATEDNTVTVLSVCKPLLPGHILEKSDIQCSALSEINFRLLTGVNGLYTEADLTALVGQVVVDYLPAGSYLSYTNVAASFNPANPWSRTDDKQVLVPLQITVDQNTWTQYLWGNEAAVKIEAQTKITTQTPGTDAPMESDLPEGIKYSNSIVESMVMDTYEIQNILIVDVLDSKGNSLFSRYSALAAVPSGHLSEMLNSNYGTVEAMQDMVPTTIVMAMASDKAALISALKANTLTVTIQDPMPEISTDLQSETYSKLQNVGAALAFHWQNMQKS